MEGKVFSGAVRQSSFLCPSTFPPEIRLAIIFSLSSLCYYLSSDVQPKFPSFSPFSDKPWNFFSIPDFITSSDEEVMALHSDGETVRVMKIQKMGVSRETVQLYFILRLMNL